MIYSFKNRKVNLILLLALIGFTLSAQHRESALSGKVIDGASNESLEFVNIVILSEDSLYVNGTTTNMDGDFYLENIPYGKNIIRISSVGYQSLFQEVYLNSERIILGPFAIKQNTYALGEIDIVGKLPQYKLINGNLTTNVENTLLSTIGTANEVIGRIPGISVGDDHGITVFGKGEPIIYINNRKIYDMNELNQLQSSDIATVELLKNPGSRYDATSKAVLIIKTKKREDGFSVNTTSKIWIHKDSETAESINMAYSNGKLNSFFSYYYTHLKSETDEKTDYSIYGDTLWNQLIDQPYIYQSNVHDISTSIDYSFTDKQIAGVQYRGSFSSDRNNLNGLEIFNANESMIEQINNRTLLKENPRTHLINFFYNGNFNDKFETRFDMDYVHKKSSSSQFTSEESTIQVNNRLLEINSNSNFKLWAGKLVGIYTIGADSHLEFGTEYNTIEGNGFYINNHDSQNDNIYTNNEDRLAAFLGYSTSLKDININLGIRYEYSHEKSTEDSVGIVNSNKHYNDIYPSLTLSKMFGDGDVGVAISANRRTQRPLFSQLNSNNLYVNRFLTQKGNPYLKKEDYYEVNTILLYKILNISLGYSYIKNPIAIDFVNDNNSQASSTLSYINHDKYQNISGMISVNHRVGFWNPQLSLGAIKPFFSAIYKNEKRDYNKANFRIDFDNDFVLPKDFVLSFYLTFQNDHYVYLSKFKGYTEFNVRARKSFFDDKLHLNLYGGDVFNVKKEKETTEVKEYNMTITRKRITQYMSFSVQYIFNNTKKQYRGKNASSSDINRL